eukprot:TRINITY_DN55396_c0_g1_i1.p1 TRINITY_DN55396_c0_g1~~TRINITY_DN55396_c0_g1_i1.p1  ORF type:complete len:442 (-),score=53.07 TRINITY_DN55396_c0_g1_i1:114-1397(-)
MKTDLMHRLRYRDLVTAWLAVALEVHSLTQPTGSNQPGSGSFMTIPRIASSELSVSDFQDLFVGASKPVVISGLSSIATLDDNLLRRACHDWNVSFTSGPIQAMIGGLDQNLLVDVILTAATVLGIPEERAFEWADQRLYGSEPLSEFLDSFSSDYLSHEELESRLNDMNVSPAIRALAGTIVRPKYVNDQIVAPTAWCRQLLDHYVVSKYMVENLANLARDHFGLNMCSDGMWPRVFLGPRSAKSYPMHRNMCRLDAIMFVMTGKKRSVILSQSGERQFQKVSGMGDIPIDFWEGDFLSSNRSLGESGGDLGWAGEIQGGDLLYLPGHLAHDFVNLEPTIALVHWYAHEGTFRRLSADAGEDWVMTDRMMVSDRLKIIQRRQATLASKGFASSSSPLPWPRDLYFADFDSLYASGFDGQIPGRHEL